MSENSTEKMAALEKQLEQTVEPELRLPLLNMLSEQFRNTEIDKAKTYAEEARLLALELNDKNQLGESLLNLGRTEEMQFDFLNALKHLTEAEELLTANKNYDKLFLCISSIGKSHTQQGDYPAALQYFYKSIALTEEMGAPAKTVNALINTGIVHARIEEWQEAIVLYERALALSKANNYSHGIAFALVNMGASYMSLENAEKGLESFLGSAEILKNSPDRVNYSNTLGNIGIVYTRLGKYDLAEQFLKESYAIKDEAGDHHNQLNNHIALAVLYRLKKEYDKAEEQLELGEKIAGSSTSSYLRKQIYQAYHEFYEATGLFEKALHYYKLGHKLEKEIMGEEKNRQMKNLQVKYEVDSIRSEKEIYRLRNIDLANANEEISRQKALIEEKNKDITDSISYAGRIQRAILPKAEEFNRLFTESFILYKPRDIVSGDFYWVAEKNNHRFVAVVDCTGHGVPGALMSMIGNTLLCEIVEKMNISDPGRILDALREGIIQTLHQTGAAHETKDGMDISLARFTDNGEGRVTIDYAGANNKLWLISPVPEKQFIEIDGDHQPIGIHPRKKAFTTNSFEVRKGTLVYLFSDGFADQFGGRYEKKFKYSQMKTILSMNAGLTMGEQQRRLEQSFFDWKGNLEQVDDVCFIGIRV